MQASQSQVCRQFGKLYECGLRLSINTFGVWLARPEDYHRWFHLIIPWGAADVIASA